MWLAKNVQISDLQIKKKKSYEFRNTYLLQQPIQLLADQGQHHVSTSGKNF
jgi:hypothetical protein